VPGQRSCRPDAVPVQRWRLRHRHHRRRPGRDVDGPPEGAAGDGPARQRRDPGGRHHQAAGRPEDGHGDDPRAL